MSKVVVHKPTTSKATTANPKDIIGSAKASLTKVPFIAIVHASDAMMDGAGKYDPYNWRAKSISAMNYIDAAIRHLGLWVEGEEEASDSGALHLGHAIATIAILIDAKAHGCLIDDRPTSDKGVAANNALETVKSNESKRKEKQRG